MPTFPCVHLSSLQPSRCLIGRTAPRDCRSGCAGYDDGLAEAERVRWDLWARIQREAPRPEYPFPIGD